MPLSRIGGGSILNRLNPALPPGSVVNAIQLNPAAPPVPPAVGLFYWNDIDKTINVVPDLSGTVIQMGQELVIRVKNNTGAQINDGQVCYLNGVDAGRPTVDLARADVAGTSQDPKLVVEHSEAVVTGVPVPTLLTMGVG